MKVLDITNLKETGLELRIAIIQGVKDTQRTIIQELPNELLMTKKQFKDLQKDPMLQLMYDSKDFLYQTPMSVMEVRVK